MNIQIFGSSKSFDTKKAQRYFKERGIKFQAIDLPAKGISKGEFRSIKQAIGSIDDMMDPKAKDQDILMLIKYLSKEDQEEKLLDNPQLLRMPIVRNGRQATIGYQPDVWKMWV